MFIDAGKMTLDVSQIPYANIWLFLLISCGYHGVLTELLYARLYVRCWDIISSTTPVVPPFRRLTGCNVEKNSK